MGKEHGRELEAQLQLLPGFRFRPTDEELIVHYLCRKAAAQPFAVPIIAEVDLYKFDPWDLPEKALVGEKEWYFFSPRDRKYPNGSRPNRAAGSGYWKATGVDKPISTFGGSMKVGVKKALVFYTGRAPKAVKTNWIMHEYLLADNGSKAAKKKGSVRLDDWVLCRIYNKTSSAQTAFNKEEGAQAQLPYNLLASSPGMDGFKLPDHFQLNVLQGYTTMEQDVKSKSNSMSHDLSEEESGHASVADESGESTLRSLLSVSSSVQQASVSTPAAPHSPPPAAAATTITTTTSAHPVPSHPLLSPLCATIPHAAAYTTTTFAGATAASRYPAQPQLSPFNSDELPSPFWRLEPLPSSLYW